jgi:hypothetical protein
MFDLWLAAQSSSNLRKLARRKYLCKGFSVGNPYALTARSLLSALVCALIILGVFNGCAYRAGSGDRQIPGGYRAIAVPVFKNNTHESGIEVFFTNSLVREIERSRIGSVTDKASSQVTLEGSIDSIVYSGSAPIVGDDTNATGLPSGTFLNSQTNITVNTTLRLRRNSDGKVLWEASFSKGQTYQTPRIGIINGSTALSGADAVYNHSARYQNIETIAADMMLEAHDRLTENF